MDDLRGRVNGAQVKELYEKMNGEA